MCKGVFKEFSNKTVNDSNEYPLYMRISIYNDKIQIQTPIKGTVCVFGINSLYHTTTF